jgi:hypothetical protein
MAVVRPDANSSSLGDHACWVCGSTDYDATALGKRLYDASDFVPPGTQRAAHDFHLRECRACGHTWTATDHPSWLTTRAHDFIRYKEPTEHFGQIRDALIGRGVDLAACSLFTFSYKDEPLLEFLRPGAAVGIDVAGLSRDWAPGVDGAPPHRLDLLRRQLDQTNTAQRVVLIRRVFEHVAARELLDEILSLADERTYLVFDMADFQTLAETTVDFVWNERRHYWSQADLVRIASPQSCIVTPVDGPAEATILGIVGGSMSDTPLGSEALSWYLATRLQDARDRYRRELGHYEAIGVVGASHKGVSALQLLTPPVSRWTLFDDREVLVGQAAPVSGEGSVRAVSATKTVQPDVVIVCTAPSSLPAVAARLRGEGLRGRVVDSWLNDVESVRD